MPGCGGNNVPPGYTAQSVASSTHLELLAAEGLTRKK